MPMCCGCLTLTEETANAIGKAHTQSSRSYIEFPRSNIGLN